MNLATSDDLKAKLRHLLLATLQQPLPFKFPIRIVWRSTVVIAGIFLRPFARMTIYRGRMLRGHFEIGVTAKGELSGAYFIPPVNPSRPLGIADIVAIRSVFAEILRLEQRLLFAQVEPKGVFEAILRSAGYTAVGDLSGRYRVMVCPPDNIGNGARHLPHRRTSSASRGQQMPPR